MTVGNANKIILPGALVWRCQLVALCLPVCSKQFPYLSGRSWTWLPEAIFWACVMRHFGGFRSPNFSTVQAMTALMEPFYCYYFMYYYYYCYYYVVITGSKWFLLLGWLKKMNVFSLQKGPVACTKYILCQPTPAPGLNMAEVFGTNRRGQKCVSFSCPKQIALGRLDLLALVGSHSMRWKTLLQNQLQSTEIYWAGVQCSVAHLSYKGR